MILATEIKIFLRIISFIFLALTLGQIFLGSWILPQTFSLGFITIHYYGLIMASAVASGFYLAKKRAAKYGISEKMADDIVFWLIIGGFLGARFYHVLSSFSYYQDHPGDVFKVWQGGLSIYGAVLGGLVALLLCKRIFNFQFSIFKTLDWLTPSLIFGQIIGRFGNLFNYEAFGYPTTLPWKMFVPEGFRPAQYQNSIFFHPWFLYEQIGLIIIYLIIAKKDKTQNKSLFLWYFLLYNILRLALESLRIDSAFVLGFRQNLFVSLTIVVASLVLIAKRKYGKVP